MPAEDEFLDVAPIKETVFVKCQQVAGDSGMPLAIPVDERNNRRASQIVVTELRELLRGEISKLQSKKRPANIKDLKMIVDSCATVEEMAREAYAEAGKPDSDLVAGLKAMRDGVVAATGAKPPDAKWKNVGRSAPSDKIIELPKNGKTG